MAAGDAIDAFFNIRNFLGEMMENIHEGDAVVSLDEDRLPIQGTVRWIGNLSSITVVGIECNNRIGSNDGTFKGQRFFSCDNGFGEFVPLRHVMKKRQYVSVFGSPELKIDPKQELVRVHLYVDDGNSSAGPIPYAIGRYDTMRDLKKRLYEEYTCIEPHKQEWIIGGQVRQEDDTKISQFVKLVTGLPVYLNILHKEKEAAMNWRVCVKCYTLNVDGDACKKCGYLEESSDDTIVLGDGQEESGTVVLWPARRWPCLLCTYVNSGCLPICRSCKAEKPDETDDTRNMWEDTSDVRSTRRGGRVAKWVCFRCSFVNPSTAIDCSGCQVIKPEKTDEKTKKRKGSRINSKNAEGPTTKKKCTAQSTGAFEELLCKGNSMKWMCYECSASYKTGGDLCDNCKKLLKEIEENVNGWQCIKCNMVNVAARPGCLVCTEPRPDSFNVPEEALLAWEKEEKKREQTFMETKMEAEKRDLERMLLIQKEPVNQPLDNFVCKICFDDTEPKDGVLLNNCLHSFCKDCMTGYLESNEEAEIKCPFVEGEVLCQEIIQEREIRAIVSKEAFKRWQAISVGKAESTMENAFHCKTVNCIGWCTYEQGVNSFVCDVCGHENCINCQAIHEGQDCSEYQNGLSTDSRTTIEARQTKEGLKKMIEDGEAMRCPKCKTIITKLGGCDSLVCRVCITELCWATRGPRWGPKGFGDSSGGCHCGEYGRRCHPSCRGCH